MIANIAKAPLKSQQRVNILSQIALPKLYHDLTIGVAYRKTLRRMDVLVRERVHTCLHRPKDTFLAFYAKCISGGLNIPSLITSILNAQRGSMERPVRPSLGLVRLAIADSSFANAMR